MLKNRKTAVQTMMIVNGMRRIQRGISIYCYCTILYRWRFFFAEMAVGASCCDAATRGSFEKAELKKKWFVDFFDGFGFFLGCCGEGVETDGSAVELFDEGGEEVAVDGIEAEFVDRKHGERFVGNVGRDDAVVTDLSDVANAFEEAIGDSWCFAGASGDSVGSGVIDVEVEDGRAAGDDFGHVIVGIEVEVEGAAETVAERGGEE